MFALNYFLWFDILIYNFKCIWVNLKQRWIQIILDTKMDSQLPAMNRKRWSTTNIFVTFIMLVCLIYQFNNSSTYFWDLPFNGGPTIILELSNLESIIYFAIGYVEFSSCIIWTTFTVYIFYEYLIILNFIVGPISRAFSGTITNLKLIFVSYAFLFINYRFDILTSEIIISVETLCSEIILQKSPIVFSIGSCAIINDSVLSYPSINDAFM